MHVREEVIPMRQRRTPRTLAAVSLVICFLLVNAAAVFAENDALVAHYSFDGTLKDSSGNNNNGTAVGTITYVPGPLGMAALFDGKSSVQVNDSDSLDLGKEFTFSVWLNEDPTDIDKSRGILTKLGSDLNTTIPAYSISERSLQPELQRYDASDAIDFSALSSGRRIDAHRWQLLTITYDGESVRFYRNGELFSQKESAGGTRLAGSSGMLQIGMAALQDGKVFYSGRMDDLRIYNRALAQPEIAVLYQAALAGPGRDLVAVPPRMIAYYDFNETTADSSGCGNDGVTVGTISYVDSVATKGASFDGKSFIEVKDSDSLQLAAGCTVTCWLKLDLGGEGQSIQPVLTKLKSSLDSSLPAYAVSVDTAFYSPKSGRGYVPSITFYGFRTEGQHPYTTETRMAPGAWSLLTITYDGKTTRFFLDGALTKSSEGEDDAFTSSSGKLVIGQLIDRGTSNFTRGVIDELRIYNYALDDASVRELAKLRDGISIKLPPGTDLTALKAGQKLQLAANLVRYRFVASNSAPGTGTDTFVESPETVGAAFKSLTPKVATVSAGGELSALSKGKTTIQVLYKEMTTTLNITVK
jgi:Concanavalin A-like lectin/glucanases superfamily